MKTKNLSFVPSTADSGELPYPILLCWARQQYYLMLGLSLSYEWPMCQLGYFNRSYLLKPESAHTGLIIFLSTESWENNSNGPKYSHGPIIS